MRKACLAKVWPHVVAIREVSASFESLCSKLPFEETSHLTTLSLGICASGVDNCVGHEAVLKDQVDYVGLFSVY